ncbi:Mov34-domain-containing protein [Phlebopus sp. FC_14]|nr:Mov34-domain-containing protein [Phlebopus sp. FC_14]
MPLGPSSSAVYIQNTRQASLAANPPRPTSLTVHPTALLSILDHFLRRTEHQHRVIGTLLGTRPTPSTVSVTHAFAVLHSETEEQVAVDMEYHRSMFDMYVKGRGESGGSGKEGLSIVGWYATGVGEGQNGQTGQGGLGTYSALIQNFYEQETAPYPAVHVALDTGTEEGVGAGVRAYVSSPVGVFPKAENCVFVPIPCDLQFHEAERSGLDLLLSASSTSQPVAPSTSSLPALHSALVSTSESLNRVLAHVQSIIRGTTPPEPALGRYLWSKLGAAPDEDGSWASGGGQDNGWATAMQDGVMVGYLANLVRGQAEVAARLALAGGA